MRTVIITGISGGLGKALFDRLAQEQDVRLLGIGRHFLPDQVQRATLWQHDLSRVEDVPKREAFACFLLEHPCDEVVFLHNAGMVEPLGPVGQLDSAQMVSAVHLNLLAPMLLTNEFLAAVSGLDVRVKLLFISSGAAKRVIEGWSVYCATKAGGEQFFDVLAAQYKQDERYLIASVNPGVMDTNMQRVIRSGVDFPEKERYVRLKEEGQLPAPDAVAERIVQEYGLV
ncbi:benzil reductase ((S)-benzoin forming) [Thermosporothrix hazakensis]|uniref:Benzil reductase ((S)-benzoin forming) n=1 Tax=Thermosporothrix hazakensis TaxID=644383 RepID=A0A326U5K5_THEHA|nr:SDR family NAD(P)-dependent oxidoreductase [Thermosporothrix hazakensis]PZW29236.1 benzil reductase ((S)-benzoin forming) [Thermosporothrix hazakensis]GCE45411.1 short-chain dehydrogenase [Thermosporothrix hazakensis]